ncbi:hypothetical protein ABK040_009564 [Willaertia magna]
MTSHVISSIIKFLLSFPFRIMNTSINITKNALYVMSLILLADYLYLKNHILKKQYAKLYGKPYIPLHLRLGDLVRGATYLTLPPTNMTTSSNRSNRLAIQNKY